MEAALTSSEDQTGITIKLWKIIQNNQLNTSWREALYPQTDRRSPFTTIRLVGSAEAAGKAGLPQVAAEVPEGYSHGQGVTPETCGV